MNLYLTIKTIHILSSTILFGTGVGIAFFMVRSAFTSDIHDKLYAARNTVLADIIFTLPAVIVQPASGAWLVWYAGFDWTAQWLLITYVFYVVAGACWIPVVWLQIQMKKMLLTSVQEQQPLPSRYHQFFRLWFALGWPAFLSLIGIFYLMVAKPI